jgi:hypothetical protein
VFIRVDVRGLSDGFVDNLLRVLSELDCLLVTPAGEIVEPRLEPLCDELARSSAWRFVEDPEGFLRGLLRRRPR